MMKAAIFASLVAGLAMTAAPAAAQPTEAWFMASEGREECEATHISPVRYIQAARRLDGINPLIREVMLPSGRVYVAVTGRSGTATFWSSLDDCQRSVRRLPPSLW